MILLSRPPDDCAFPGVLPDLSPEILSSSDFAEPGEGFLLSGAIKFGVVLGREKVATLLRPLVDRFLPNFLSSVCSSEQRKGRVEDSR